MGISITDIFGGSVLDGVSKIIGNFKASPDEKLKLQELLQQNQDAFAQAQMDYEAKLDAVAGQNIQAETSSAHAFTRNARPFFLWVMAAGIAFNILVPLVGRIFHYDIQPLDLSPYMELFTAGFLGYVGARSFEKFKGVD